MVNIQKILNTPTTTEVIGKTNEVIDAVNTMSAEGANLVGFEIQNGNLIMQTASSNGVSGYINDNGNLILELGGG